MWGGGRQGGIKGKTTNFSLEQTVNEVAEMRYRDFGVPQVREQQEQGCSLQAGELRRITQPAEASQTRGQSPEYPSNENRTDPGV